MTVNAGTNSYLRITRNKIMLNLPQPYNFKEIPLNIGNQIIVPQGKLVSKNLKTILPNTCLPNLKMKGLHLSKRQPTGICHSMVCLIHLMIEIGEMQKTKEPELFKIVD